MPRQVRVPPGGEDKVRELYLADVPLYRIAAEVGVTVGGVRILVARMGLPARPRSGPRRGRPVPSPPPTRQEIAAAKASLQGRWDDETEIRRRAGVASDAYDFDD
jgi:hypothetical protein